jgi:myosin heavy chain 6/7
MKLQARLTEAQGTMEQLNAKLMQVEKAKGRLQSELEEMAAQTDQAHILNSSMEKKAKQFDKIVSEWKNKVDSLSRDLDIAQKECRNASSELFRIKSAYEESVLQLDEVRKENKCLSNEIKDIMDQISEGGRSIHEIDKIRKRLEAEKLELQSALEEAEGVWNKKKTKCCVLSWSSLKSGKRLSVELLKRRKNSKAQERITKRQLMLCKQL